MIRRIGAITMSQSRDIRVRPENISADPARAGCDPVRDSFSEPAARKISPRCCRGDLPQRRFRHEIPRSGGQCRARGRSAAACPPRPATATTIRTIWWKSPQAGAALDWRRKFPQLPALKLGLIAASLSCHNRKLGRFELTLNPESWRSRVSPSSERNGVP